MVQEISEATRIDIVARTSSDNGTTWGTQYTAVAHTSSSAGFDNAHGDAAVVTDRESGKMLYSCALLAQVVIVVLRYLQ
jgi:hypothetical protein